MKAKSANVIRRALVRVSHSDRGLLVASLVVLEGFGLWPRLEKVVKTNETEPKQYIYLYAGHKI